MTDQYAEEKRWVFSSDLKESLDLGGGGVGQDWGWGGGG